MTKKITLSEIKIIFLTALLGISSLMGTDIHLASLPSIATFMHTDKQHAQQSISIFLLGLGASLLVYGPLSDKHGRKPIIILGLTIATIASIASAFTTHIAAFLMTRLFQGIGSGVCMGLGRTILADTFRRERLANAGSYFAIFLSLSPLIAPAIGGYIQHLLGWQANFIVLGVFMLLVMIIFVIFCPETNHYKNPRAFSLNGLYHNYKSLLFHPVFVGCTLLTGVALSANMAYATISSFLFQVQFHMSPVSYGWVTSMVGIAAIIGKFANPFLLRRYGSLNTLLMGVWLILFAGACILLTTLVNLITSVLIIVTVFISILGQGLILPNAIAGALEPFHDKRGAASALYGSFQVLTAFVCSAIIGTLAVKGVIILGITYTILAVIGLIAYFKLVVITDK